MSFNYKLMSELREKKGVSRPIFAQLLGVGYNHIQKIETGKREPSVDLLFSISRHIGVPMEIFIADDGERLLDSPEMVVGPDNMAELMKLLNELNRERFTMKELKGENAELKRRLEHALTVNALQEKFITILRQDSSAVDKGKKIADLARSAIREGKIHFDEAQAFLRVPRKTLKQWLETKKGDYRCDLLDKTVSTTTPAEAGIMFGCFDCEARENEICPGYSDNNSPENLFMIVAQMEANGIHSREDQAKLLHESFGMEPTAHQLADALSKQKHGKRVSEDMVNMTYKRK